MDRDSWEELGHGDVKKCDLVIWGILLISKINVLPNPNSYILVHDVTRSLALKVKMQLLYILLF